MIIIIIEIMLHKNLCYELYKYVHQNNLVLLNKINKNILNLINNYIDRIEQDNYFKFYIINDSLGFKVSSINNYIISILIIKNIYDWDWGLQRACKGGHMRIVNLMIEKG